MTVEYYHPIQENDANIVIVPTQINAVAANAGVPNAIATTATRIRAAMAAAAAAALHRANTLPVNAVATPVSVPAPIVLPVLPSEDVVVAEIVVVEIIEIVEHTIADVPAPVVLPVLPSEDVVVAEIVVAEIIEMVEPVEPAAPPPRGLPVLSSADVMSDAVATASGKMSVDENVDVNKPQPAKVVKNTSRRVRSSNNQATCPKPVFQIYNSLGRKK